MFMGRLQYFQKITFNLTKLVIIKSCSKQDNWKKMKLLLQFVRYVKVCVTSRDWLDKFHSFFSASFLLATESERFIFLGTFCNLLVQIFQSRVGWLFCENNQKWLKTKHCSDTFDSSDIFDSSDSNERFWQIFTNAEDRQTTVHRGEFRLHH